MTVIILILSMSHSALATQHDIILRVVFILVVLNVIQLSVVRLIVMAPKIDIFFDNRKIIFGVSLK